MLGWSFNLFRVRGIMLSVHFTFLLLLAYSGYVGWEIGGTEGMFWYAGVTVAFFTCVILHEFGHSLTAMHFGIGVRRILLMPIGGMAEFESIPREPSKELWITIAGPAVNFAIAGILALIVGPIREWPWYALSFPATPKGFFLLLQSGNIMMGLFNLLPAFPMDGGRILRSLLAFKLPYLSATFWAASIGKVVCIASIIWAGSNELWMLVALFFFILVVGELEYRAVKRRALEEEYWRQVAERTAVFVK